MPNAKAYIAGLTPYQPGLPIELVAREYGLDPRDICKLASNENPLGPSPKALRALAAAAKDAHRYPEQYALIQALASHCGVDPAAIVLGNGSNDILDLIARTYLGSGDEAISSQYGFAVYQIATQAAGARNRVVPAAAYGHDLDAMLQAITPSTRVIWIANPNNPTGTFVAYGVLKQFLGNVRHDIMVVLDEAYYEYLSPENRVDTTAWIADHPNLFLVRTFSKIYGLAGLRVGYGITTPADAGLLNRVRQPFNTNSLAIAAATAALQDRAFVAKSYALNNSGRAQLVKGLQSLGFTCLPNFGNFVTFTSPAAVEIVRELLSQGIIVRPLVNYGMPEWVRVTVGLPERNERFLAALGSIV